MLGGGGVVAERNKKRLQLQKEAGAESEMVSIATATLKCNFNVCCWGCDKVEQTAEGRH